MMKSIILVPYYYRTIHYFRFYVSICIIIVSSFLCILIHADTILPIQLYGLNYNTRKGPDWDPNKCKSIDEVISDLQVLNKITKRIRLLSLTDCDQGTIVLNAIAQGKIDMALWLGMWVSADVTVFESELTELKNMIKSKILPASNVLGITVGSEAIYRGEVTADQVIGYSKEVKELLRNSSITNMPVALVDIADVYLRDTQLFDATDVVTINVFPFWEKLNVNNAVTWLINTKLPPVWTTADTLNKDYLISETGWSSQGYSPSASEATPEYQARYFQDFYCQYDILVQQKYQYYYFTGIETEWRLSQADDKNSVEGHFGILYGNLTLKPNFQNLVFSCNETGDDSVKYRFDLGDGPRSIPTSTPTSTPQTTSPSILTGSPTAVTGVTTRKPSQPNNRNTMVPSPAITNSTGVTTRKPLQPNNRKTMVPSLAITNTSIFQNSSCASYDSCAALNLAGNCCPPGKNQKFLECCFSTNKPTSLLTNLVTTTAPTRTPTATITTTSTLIATAGKTEAPTALSTIATTSNYANSETPQTSLPSDRTTPTPTINPTDPIPVDRPTTRPSTSRSDATLSMFSSIGKSKYTSSVSCFAPTLIIVAISLFF